MLGFDFCPIISLSFSTLICWLCLVCDYFLSTLQTVLFFFFTVLTTTYPLHAVLLTFIFCVQLFSFYFFACIFWFGLALLLSFLAHFFRISTFKSHEFVQDHFRCKQFVVFVFVFFDFRHVIKSVYCNNF